MQPAPFQIEASQFVYERDHSMIFAKMGTGKTLTFLLAIQDWLETGAAKRVMIVAPLRVAKFVWKQEIEKWNLPITASILTGDMSARQRREAVAADTQVLITNYEMAPKLMAEGGHRCTALVLDELSKVRNPTGKRQKAIRNAKGFTIRTGGTGTPAPNGLSSVFGMLHAVGLSGLVGNSFYRWRMRYFEPLDYHGWKWRPREGAKEAILGLIKPHTFILDNRDVGLPPVVRPPVPVYLPPVLEAAYKELRSQSALTDEQIIADTGGVMFSKLRQLTSGFAYNLSGDAVSFDNFKLDVLSDIFDEQNGAPLLIAYEFKEQLRMLLDRWPGTPYIGGGDDDRTLAQWNAGELPLLFLHPASAGHGLNMQAGGNAIAWMQVPVDLELYEQTLARLVRRGQKGPVYSYEPYAVGTIDERIHEMLADKASVQAEMFF